MLNQYILVKRQNKRLEEENVMVMLEKNRIQKLLQDIQNALDSFNARSPMSNVTAMITNSLIVPPMENSIKHTRQIETKRVSRTRTRQVRQRSTLILSFPYTWKLEQLIFKRDSYFWIWQENRRLCTHWFFKHKIGRGVKHRVFKLLKRLIVHQNVKN